MNPRKLTGRIIGKGCEVTFAEIIFEIAEKNSIELPEVCNLIAGNKMTAESTKAGTNSSETIAGQVRRLIHRVDKRLKK